MDQPTDNGHAKQTAMPPAVMIFGGGACARKIAANLAGHGVEAWLAAGHDVPEKTGSHDPMHRLVGAQLNGCRGFAGNFELQLKDGQRRLHKIVPAIVLAPDPSHRPNYAPYGLAPGPRVIDISALEAKLQLADGENPLPGADGVVFLCGWHTDTHPSVASRMLDGCFQLQHHLGLRTYFLTGNLKVASTGAEKRVQAAKRSGTVFLKFSDDFPAIVPEADNRYDIDCMDETTRTALCLRADWIVVDETIGPAPNLAALAQKLGLDRDGGGFAQGDNVRRMSNATNRRGIFVAGGGRGIFSASEQVADADQVSLDVLAFLQDRGTENLPTVSIQRGRCARCLTCYRLCPHTAIDIGPRISIVPAACQGCGICMAGCPARAIEMQGVQIDAQINRCMRPSASTTDDPQKTPRIMVFGCARSAGQALALIRLMGQSLPAGVQFVEVPCGGSIAERDLLVAFESGADGVMLCPCHTDNCQSDSGNRVALKRVASVGELIASAGMEDDCLRVVPVAANMGVELALKIEAFARELRSPNAS